MNVVLVHGWGFHAGIWDAFVACLGEASVTRIDLGFVAGGAANGEDWPEDAIAIGHSLGLLWLLQRGHGRHKALVSIQGFDRYCPHVPVGRVIALKRGVRSDPERTLQAFWQSCGAPDFADPAALRPEKLGEGLDWLMHWDAEAAKTGLKCPIMTLASRDDAIVPPAMSAAVWGDDEIIWSQDGGHVLPLSRPEWCAHHVLEFAHHLPA